MQTFDHRGSGQLLYFKGRFLAPDHPRLAEMVTFSTKLRKLGAAHLWRETGAPNHRQAPRAALHARFHRQRPGAPAHGGDARSGHPEGDHRPAGRRASRHPTGLSAVAAQPQSRQLGRLPSCATQETSADQANLAFCPGSEEKSCWAYPLFQRAVFGAGPSATCGDGGAQDEAAGTWVHRAGGIRANEEWI